MNKIKEFFKDKKNIKVVGCAVGGIVVIALIVLVLVLFVFKSNEAKLTKELEDVGRNFYEEFYYKQVGNSDSDKSEFLSKFSTIGIKIDLENLARTSDNQEELLKKFVNKKTGEECNKNNTKITIYPKDPYGQKDYTIETTIDCGFDK